MKKYKIKLTCPTSLTIDSNVYVLFPDKEIELPENNEIIKTYIALGYLQEVEKQEKNKKETK